MKKLALVATLTFFFHLLTFGQHLVKITSEPAEAAVFADCEFIDVTPCTVNMKVNAGKAVVVMKENYVTDTLKFDPEKKEFAKLFTLVPKSNDPSPFKDKESQLIIVTKVVTSIKSGTKIGHHDDTRMKVNYTFAFETEQSMQYQKELVEKALQNEHVNVAVVNKLFPESSNNINKAKLSLAAEIQSYEINSKGKQFESEYKDVTGKVEIKWVLLDNRKEKVIFTHTTQGCYYAKGPISDRGEGFSKSIEEAVAQLARNSEFVNLLMDKGSSSEGTLTGSTEPITLEPVELETFTNNSELIKRAVESSVSIKTESAIGSGFIISSDGFVITNHHVIENARDIEIIFSNGFIVKGEVIRSDEKWDLALVKIDMKNLKPLPMETEDAYSIGDEVVAIGTPRSLALGQSVTKGIVSGMRRGEEGRKYIQTDVSINPGNSGGPLISKDGKVIGCIVAKFDGEGLGLAIPSRIIIEMLKLNYGE